MKYILKHAIRKPRLVLRAIRHPRLILREFNRLYYNRLGRLDCNPHGTDIFEDEEWDNLIILDACRYDIFEKVSNLPGELEKRTSCGSMSKEFVIGNFSNKTLHDVVYVSGNSWYGRVCDEINAEVHDYIHVISGAKNITEHAKEADDNYPNKRLIVHYMLPHFPYIGPYAEEHFPSEEEQREKSLFKLGRNEVTDEELRKAYVDNLEIVLPEVEELLKEFRGKTVVTADHGEMLGDRARPIPHKDYGHSMYLYVPELVTVPWLVHKNGKKRIIDEPPETDNLEGIQEEEIKNQLENLGYNM